MARIFIGDVQGCAEQLQELLRRLQPDPSRDQIHFVGDLVSRGPASAEVLRAARALGALCVLGNHEAHLIERGLFADRPVEADAFPHCRDLALAPDRVELGAWVRSWPVLRDLGDILLVHAAVPPRLWSGGTIDALSAAETEFAVAARYCDAAGRRPPSDWPPPGPPFAPWHNFYRGPWTVVFGHWARQGLLVAPRLRGLDTGCVYGGQLTAWIAETDTVVQV